MGGSKQTSHISKKKKEAPMSIALFDVLVGCFIGCSESDVDTMKKLEMFVLPFSTNGIKRQVVIRQSGKQEG